MIKLFSRYMSVGILNTAIHWGVFALLMHEGNNQSLSNFAAFCVAVTFSFFVNAKWTFSSEATAIRYVLYVFFMGSVAALTGYLADAVGLPPVLTLCIFSGISLVAGFIYSKFFVFRN
ncbi:GtrA family protein [Pantoea sp. MBD-2R]|uniref:GtrA family protein n=1 Tax=Pantoea sp. MBD-2R TaxID=3141540 RepID=UPI0031830A1B